MSSINHIPESFGAPAVACAKALSELDQVLIAAHVNLDGDALGSLAACGYMFKSLNRDFVLYSSTGIPAYLQFFTLPGPVISSLAQLPFEPQAALYVDCSEASRLGRQLEDKVKEWPSVNIDHHLCDNGLGSLYNFIDPQAAATSQLIAYIALAMDIKLAGDIGYSVALGLITDTGGFCHGNTTADVFSLCALLMRNGCSLSQIREKLQNNWSFGRLKLWGRMLTRVKLEDKGKIAICAVTLKDLHEFHCNYEDLEGLVEWLRKIKGALVSAVIKEESLKECKFSLRSYGETDVQVIAASLGGGGHKNAAGGTIHDSLDKGRHLLLKVIEAALE